MYLNTFIITDILNINYDNINQQNYSFSCRQSDDSEDGFQGGAMDDSDDDGGDVAKYLSCEIGEDGAVMNQMMEGGCYHVTPSTFTRVPNTENRAH